MAGQGATYNSFSNGLFPVGKTKVEAIIIIALCTLPHTAQVCVFHLSLHNINPFLAWQPQRIKSNTNNVPQTSATINANKGDIVVRFSRYSSRRKHNVLLYLCHQYFLKIMFLTSLIEMLLLKNELLHHLFAVHSKLDLKMFFLSYLSSFILPDKGIAVF